MPIKILKCRKMGGGIFASLCFLGCATNPELATTNPRNILDRSSIEIEDYKFFRIANTNDFTACVKHLSTRSVSQGTMCRNGEWKTGASFDAVQFSVSIEDNRAFSSESVRDYSMYLAGALSSRLGYDYFTTIDIREYRMCDSIPSAHSSGRVDSYGNYHGTTTITNDTDCSNLYTAEYLAFKDYDPIKLGILVQESEDRKPTWHIDLYYCTADSVEAAKNGSLDFSQPHPEHAWKYYFPSANTVQAAVAKHGLSSSPDVMEIVKKKRAGERSRDLRKELIIWGQ